MVLIICERVGYISLDDGIALGGGGGRGGGIKKITYFSRSGCS